MGAQLPPVTKATVGYVHAGAGRSLLVDAFSVGALAFAGGTIALASDGAWYVGVDLFRNTLIALPRLGHRGWVPLASVIAANGAISSIQQIAPALPASRLPRTLKKIISGQPVNVLVMGSSLAEGSTADYTYWAGMLFYSGAPTTYRVSNVATFNNFALGGTPNQYQLAQLGRAGSHNAVNYADSGYSSLISTKTPPNGRSPALAAVDLVVLTCLANGGDYRLESIEPMLRILRKRGIEVILTTDNAQGWDGTRANLDAASLYVDGPEVVRLAELYGAELADTAAYVADAQVRYLAGTYPNAIYRDSIHMAFGAPAGLTAAPAGGYEVWARAVRSLIPVLNVSSGAVVNSYNFASGTQGWTAYGPYGAVATGGNDLVISKNSASSGQWGGEVALPDMNVGDTVVVTGTLAVPTAYGGRPVVGIYQSGWASNSPQINADGAFSLTLTASALITGGSLLFFGQDDAAASGSAFTVANLTVTCNTSLTSYVDALPGCAVDARPLPLRRMLTDLKTPGDAFIILPKDEIHYTKADGNAGSLGASPNGSGSFARRFSSAVGTSEDLLTLGVGKYAGLSAFGVVGFSLIYYTQIGDAQCTFDIYQNNAYQQTVTIPAQASISREIYLPLYTPTTYNNAGANPNNDTLDLRVTSGVLRIAALVALTFDMDFFPPDAASRCGAWASAAKVPGPHGPGAPGYGTDTAGDYAVFVCPPTGNRVSWAIAGCPNSQAVDMWSGETIEASYATGGNYHFRLIGHNVGPGEPHCIKLDVANTAGDANGYGLHLAGIIVTNDR
ncbi:MAG: hypothetical protein ABSF67_02715 [Roseiarcus sp.]|jgi:hypothetical protein